MASDSKCASPTFKIGDRVRLHPKFAHLYAGDSGVIVGIVVDPMRSLFNEYLVQFSDHSKASLFQFQIREFEKAWKIS